MNKRKKEYIWLIISVVSYLAMSLSFLFMPSSIGLDDIRGVRVNHIAGGAFWLFLLIGIISQFILTRIRNSWFIRGDKGDKKIEYGRIGVISFFINRLGTVADITMIISLTGFAISILVTHSEGYICYVFITLICFSFCMHCILNGKNFQYISK